MTSPIRGALSIATPLGLMAVLALGLTGCIPGTTVTSSMPPVETFTGELQEGTVSQVDCEWLRDTAGRQIAVMWPPGWDVKFRPLRILDDQGRVLAKAGDVLAVTGSRPMVGESMCPGLLFVASSVEAIE